MDLLGIALLERPLEALLHTVDDHFDYFISLEARCFLFFYLDNWAIMLFKTA